MEQCDGLGCTKPAVMEKEITAPFSMSSTATRSRSTKKLCEDCDAAEKRIEEFHRPITLNTLK